MNDLLKLIDDRVSRASNGEFLKTLSCTVTAVYDDGNVTVQSLETGAEYTVPNYSGSAVSVGEGVQLFYKGNLLSRESAYIGASLNKGVTSVKLTRSQYDNMSRKDTDAIYYVVEADGSISEYMGDVQINDEGGGGDSDLLPAYLDGTLTEIVYSSPPIIAIASSVCNYNPWISNVEIGNVEMIYNYAFADCTSLERAYFKNAIRIGSSAFQGCNRLYDISFPRVSAIDYAAFSNCGLQGTYAFPYLEHIGSAAFYNCNYLQNVQAPSVSYIGGNVFINCTSLFSAQFPYATEIGSGAFQNCRLIPRLSFNRAVYVYGNAFQLCSSVSTAFFPAVSYVGTAAFSGCYNLQKALLSNTDTLSHSIYGNAFMRCYNLLSLYLFGSSMYQLANSVTTFSYTPIVGYTTSTGGVYGSIYVPESLYSDYMASTYWARYSERFVSLTAEQVSEIMEEFS